MVIANVTRRFGIGLVGLGNKVDNIRILGHLDGTVGIIGARLGVVIGRF